MSDAVPPSGVAMHHVSSEVHVRAVECNHAQMVRCRGWVGVGEMPETDLPPLALELFGTTGGCLVMHRHGGLDCSWLRRRCGRLLRPTRLRRRSERSSTSNFGVFFPEGRKVKQTKNHEEFEFGPRDFDGLETSPKSTG